MEKVKSGLLILLVLLSLALSYLLWYGSPPYELSRPITSERIQFSSSRTLSELVVPDRVVFTREDGVHHLFGPGQELFQAAFTLFKNTLQEALSWREAEEEELAALEEEGGVRLDFLYPYPFIDRNNQAVEPPFPDIYQLFLPLAGEEAWLKGGEGRYYILTLGDARQDLLQRFAAAENLTPYRLLLDSDLPPEEPLSFSRELYLPEEAVEFPSQLWQREKLDLERLLRVFFIDMSLVRRIEEKDGAVIYTDGQKGARVYPNGAIEYTTAGGKDSLLAGTQALAQAGEIIALYGGWTASLYPWGPPGPEPLAERQQLLFVPYSAGKPLVSLEGGVSLSVSNRGAQSFLRNLMVPTEEPMGPVVSMPAEEVFQQAVVFVLEELADEGPLELRGFYPGYYMREPFFESRQVVSAWFLEVEGRGLAVFNAINGLPLAFLQF